MEMRNFKGLSSRWLIALLPAGILVTSVCSLYPQAVEKYYSNGLNRFTVGILSTLTGIFPFSAAELLLVLLSFLLARRLLRLGLALLKNGKAGREEAGRFFLGALGWAGLIYFAFLLLWGLNYYRQPLARLANLEIRPASVEELTEVCSGLIERANELRELVEEGEDGWLTW